MLRMKNIKKIYRTDLVETHALEDFSLNVEAGKPLAVTVKLPALPAVKAVVATLVIIAGALDGVIPTIKASLPQAEQDAAFNEQRRLFYVAITRSSDELIISSPKRLTFADARGLGAKTGRARRAGGQIVADTVATPYLAELGAVRPTPVRGEEWLTAHTA